MKTWQKPSFRFLLQETHTFVTCVEMVSTQGISTECEGTRLFKLARELSQNPRIHALCITDSAGGNAMHSGDTLGTDLISRGQEVVIHLSCKDWNRNGLHKVRFGNWLAKDLITCWHYQATTPLAAIRDKQVRFLISIPLGC